MPTKTKNNTGRRLTLASLFERVANTPLLVEQYPLDMVIAVLSGKVGTTVFDEEGEELSVKGWDGRIRATDEYTVLSDGSAIIPVQGKLAHRHYGINADSGIQSYSGVLSQMDMALEDNAVKRLVFNFDTPGGEATGAFEAARQIFNARGKKPMISIVNESATSAGYLLASATDKIYVNETGRVGSVGVIARVIDFAESEKMQGLKSHVVHSGKGKNMLANSAISGEELQWLQNKLDETYSMFVKDVATYRPELTEEKLRKIGAEVFTGKEAVDAGYADGVVSVMDLLKSPESALKTLDNTSRAMTDGKVALSQNKQQETKKMSTKLEQYLSDALGFALTGDEQADIALATETVGNIKIAKKADLDAEIAKAVEAKVSEVRAEMQATIDAANTAALSAEAENFVSKLEADGKLPVAKHEWAIKKFMADKDSFVEFMGEIAPMIPVGKDKDVKTPVPAPIKTDANASEKETMRQDLIARGYSAEAVEKAVTAAFAD